MKTILPAKETVAQLWGHPEPKDIRYRLIKYLFQIKVDEGLLLHNTVTGHLVLLTNEETELLSNLPAKPQELMQELIADHFLVPEDFDEYKSVNQLRKIYQIRSTGNAITHYVILPTTFCNAHCFYCYESDYPRVHMTEETANKIINYIDKNHQGKKVILSWFGGEPLVGIERIDQISQGLMERDIPFKSDMISNGYLFDDAVIEKSIKLWNLERVQVTLDGTEEIYNQVKAYSSVRDNPFQRVLRNIDLLTDAKVRVAIRLNLDFYNKDDILMLIEKLGERYSGNNYISVYLNMLFNDVGYERVIHSQDDIVQLQTIIEEYTEHLKELKLGHNRRSIPSLEFTQCMADNPHTVEIQPDGSFCRCEHETINDCYGNVDDGILDPQKLLLWRENIERSDYCPECNVYPACYLLRRCMNADKPCIESIREVNHKKHVEQLRNVFLKSLEDEKDERICDT